MKTWQLRLKRIAKISLVAGAGLMVLVIAAVAYMVWPRHYERTYLAAQAAAEAAPSLAALGTAARFRVGAAVHDTEIEAFTSAAARDFNSMTPANALKWGNLLVGGKLGQYDFAAADRESVVGLAVDEKDVAGPAGKRVRRRLASVRQQTGVVDQQVVEDHHFLAVGWAVVVARRGSDEDVARQPEVLLDVFEHVRVIPVDARVGKRERVLECGSRRDRILRDAGHAVETIVQPQSMPVDGRRHVETIGEAHAHGRALGDADQRAIHSEEFDRITRSAGFAG